MILISESINKLIEEIVDYHQNEDYINSKKVGTRVGGTAGGLLGGIAGYMAAKEAGASNLHAGLASLGGAAAGGTAAGTFGRIRGHYAGKEMAKDPEHTTKAAMKGFIKANLKVETPLLATLGGAAALGAHDAGVSSEEIAKNAGLAAAAFGVRSLLRGTIGAVPAGAIHSAIVRRMRRTS
jgi:hypothetical protein